MDSKFLHAFYVPQIEIQCEDYTAIYRAVPLPDYGLR